MKPERRKVGRSHGRRRSKDGYHGTAPDGRPLKRAAKHRGPEFAWPISDDPGVPYADRWQECRRVRVETFDGHVLGRCSSAAQLQRVRLRVPVILYGEAPGRVLERTGDPLDDPKQAVRAPEVRDRPLEAAWREHFAGCSGHAPPGGHAPDCPLPGELAAVKLRLEDLTRGGKS